MTFIARKRGYALGMNRDEKLTRVKGLLPTERLVEGRRVICPSESGAGTWIALNETGVTFALINWYSITARVNGAATSRGEIVAAVSGLEDESSAAARLQEFELKRINPFRLIGIFPATQRVVEWRWDLNRLTAIKHRWRTKQWISSGFDEPTAQRMRGKTFLRAGKQYSASSLNWLRRLHRSHTPQVGPFSTCMHRTDAATVSYTEVAVSSRRATMRYHPGTPCQNCKPAFHRIQLGNRESYDNACHQESGSLRRVNFIPRADELHLPPLQSGQTKLA